MDPRLGYFSWEEGFPTVCGREGGEYRTPLDCFLSVSHSDEKANDGEATTQANQRLLALSQGVPA